MESLFNVVLQNRKVLYQILKQTSPERLHRIPGGFRNSIYWNIAHVVVTHQLLVYGLSELDLGISGDLAARYRKGTFPGAEPSEEETEQLRSLLFSTIEKAKEDYTEGSFKTFTPYTTSTGVTLENVKDAMAFNAYHEGLHLGYILALQRALG